MQQEESAAQAVESAQASEVPLQQESALAAQESATAQESAFVAQESVVLELAVEALPQANTRATEATAQNWINFFIFVRFLGWLIVGAKVNNFF